ncbi:hypothetical protein JK636_14645 [Clostridium sp. YIM B02515]|uniref:Uncharacterized protein n=1 Tax=Clostridium rhizosphaerae TaxID=2803861 RepID=A0ABS1TCB4_9CLOT|nr:hypothetical protein [Clostridium rhizosphaerae]MBL4936990.1 hypothetical protein [Clostridium rhizosphaerae]
MKNKKTFITKILYGLFIIGTIISIFIVYKHIDSSFAFKFIIGYAVFNFLMVLYLVITTISNLKMIKKKELRKRFITFITVFIIFGALNYGFDYIFRPEKIDLFREFSISFGLSVGISFIRLTSLKENEGEN